MKKEFHKRRKSILNWLLYGFLIEFVENEMTFQIQIIQNDITICIQTMYAVPQIGSKVEISQNNYPNPESIKLFLVEDIIYSPYGTANKLIGKYID